MNREPRTVADPVEQEVLHALRALPRESAAPGFTDRLLRRLDEPRRRHALPRFRFRPAVAGGAVAALATALLVALVGLPAAQRETALPADEPPRIARQAARQAAVSDARAMLQELRRDHRRLKRELNGLGDFREAGAPVLYLGGDETLDLVLDLGREAPAGTVQPANYRSPPRRY